MIPVLRIHHFMHYFYLNAFYILLKCKSLWPYMLFFVDERMLQHVAFRTRLNGQRSNLINGNGFAPKGFTRRKWNWWWIVVASSKQITVGRVVWDYRSMEVQYMCDFGIWLLLVQILCPIKIKFRYRRPRIGGFDPTTNKTRPVMKFHFSSHQHYTHLAD